MNKVFATLLMLCTANYGVCGQEYDLQKLMAVQEHEIMELRKLLVEDLKTLITKGDFTIVSKEEAYDSLMNKLMIRKNTARELSITILSIKGKDARKKFCNYFMFNMHLSLIINNLRNVHACINNKCSSDDEVGFERNVISESFELARKVDECESH